MLTRRQLLESFAFGLSGLAIQASLRGQLVEAEEGTIAPSLGDVRIQRDRVGMRVEAEGGPCRGLYATLPVPAEWPEQKVRIVEEDMSRGVRGLEYRSLGGVTQMLVSIPSLPAGGKEHAIVTFELERAAIVAPEDLAGWRIPEKPGRDLRTLLGPSPCRAWPTSTLSKLAGIRRYVGPRTDIPIRKGHIDGYIVISRMSPFRSSIRFSPR